MRPGDRRVPDGKLRPAALRARLIEILKTLLIAGVAGYLGAVLLVWFGQEKLLFYPRRVESKPSAPAGWRLEGVSIATRDATRLAGVLALPPVTRPPLVIYFGGNAEEVTAYASMADAWGPRAVLFVNYRGYGDSEGSPGEAEIVSDAEEIFDWAAKRGDVDVSRIAIHGRSLGTGVAVQVTAARPARCVVLTSPFESALAVAQEKYPWLPVSMLMRHPFDSAARAPSVKAPALFLMGTADDLIPMSHSQALARLWGGPAESVVLEGFGHNDLSVSPRYGEALRAFLDRCL